MMRFSDAHTQRRMLGRVPQRPFCCLDADPPSPTTPPPSLCTIPGVSAAHAADYRNKEVTATPGSSTDVLALSNAIKAQEARVLIGIVTTKGSLNGPLINAAVNTWIKELPPTWHVYLFVGSCRTIRKDPLPQLPSVQVSASTRVCVCGVSSLSARLSFRTFLARLLSIEHGRTGAVAPSICACGCARACSRACTCHGPGVPLAVVPTS
jgi:hypothetical protein